MGLGRLGPVGVWQSAWCVGIMEVLALMRVLLMVHTFCSMKTLDWGMRAGNCMFESISVGQSVPFL